MSDGSFLTASGDAIALSDLELGYLQNFVQAGDRGGLYSAYYNMTESDQTVQQAFISTFSELTGGIAYGANWFLRALYGDGASDGSNNFYPGIYFLSQQVDQSLFDTVSDDVLAGGSGLLTDAQVFDSAEAGWNVPEAQGGDLTRWFPGNIFRLGANAFEELLSWVEGLIPAGSNLYDELGKALEWFNEQLDRYSNGEIGREAFWSDLGARTPSLAAALIGVLAAPLLSKRPSDFSDENLYERHELPGGDYVVYIDRSNGKVVGFFDNTILPTSLSEALNTLLGAAQIAASPTLSAAMEVLRQLDSWANGPLEYLRQHLYEWAEPINGDDEARLSNAPGSLVYVSQDAGTVGQDNLWGTTGGDTIDGGASNDALFGGAGTDTLHGGSGNDIMWGQQDSDHIFGDAGNDVLRGGSGDDVIEGGDDDDVLDGGDLHSERDSGQDTLVGGRGNDVLFGGNNDDHLYGDLQSNSDNSVPGNDHLYGGTGNDLLFGGGGGDVLEGGANNDELTGGTGSDRLFGEDGNDTLVGSSGAVDDYVLDTLVGGSGADTYYVGQGDSVFDEDGNGTLYYQNQSLTLTGAYAQVESGGAYYRRDDGLTVHVTDVDGDGAEDDVRVVGANTFSILNFADGNFGIQLVDMTPVDTPPPQATNTILGDFAPADDPPEYDDLDNVVTGDTPAPGREDLLYDSAGNDRIEGRGGDDNIVAWRGGDDDIDGGDGADVITGHDGNDRIAGGPGSDFMLAGFGEDWVFADQVLTLEEALAQNETGEPTGTRGDYLSGYFGNDHLIGGSGNDALTGGEGDDFLVGGVGDDDLWGDVQTLSGTRDWEVLRTITDEAYLTTFSNVAYEIVEAGGNDRLFGGAGVDWIHGEGGNDYLDGGADDDVLFAGTGDDVLVGGSGADLLQGDDANNPEAQHGSDYLDGGEGNDVLQGGGGSDVLLGGDGDDHLGGDYPWLSATYQGNDYLDGGAGNDWLQGEGGDDTILGGVGNDTMFGQAGNDLLFGDGGDDWMQGGEGDDDLDGGDGADVIFGEAGLDVLFGGLGADQLIGGDDDDVLDGGGDADLLFGQAGNDVLLGGDGNDQIQGGDGVDVLDGGAGTDTLLGEFGNDLLFGGGGNDQLQGGADDDYLDGGDNDDVLFGEAGADTLVGGAGNDALLGGAGDDTLIGGAGVDTYYITWGGGVDRLIDSVEPNGSPNYVYLTGGITLADLSLSLGSLAVHIGDQGDVIHIENFDPNDPYANPVVTFVFDDGTTVGWNQLIDTLGIPIQGTPEDDVLTGTGLADSISALAGNDFIDGQGGADTLYGQEGDDTYVVDAEDSVVELAGEGNDTIQADFSAALPDNVENLLLLGGSNINGTGNALDNTIEGNSGNNVLDGAAGTDTLIGHDGDDTYHVDQAGDVVIEAPDAGHDTVIVHAGSYVLPDNVEVLQLTGTATLGVGNAADNLLQAGAGQTAAVELRGEGGNDTLTGGAGVDTLIGGTGDDVLTGNGGADRYEVTLGDGQDVISDADSGNVIVLHGALTEADLQAERVDGGILLHYGTGGDSILITSSNPNIKPINVVSHIEFDDGTIVNIADFFAGEPIVGTDGDDVLVGTEADDTIYGLAGNDHIDGLAGGDALYGHEGDDTYVIDADDSVIEDAGQGHDTIQADFSTALPDNVEVLELTGGAASGTGNALDNTLMASTLATSVTLDGQGGNDTLVGGSAADTLVGGLGDDLLTGNGGSDRYEFAVGDGQDVISDADAANVIVLHGALTEADLQAERVDGGILVHYGTDGDSILITSTNPNVKPIDVVSHIELDDGTTVSIVDFFGGEPILGTEGNDVLVGTDGDDIIDGLAGGDTMTGGAGNDVYYVDAVCDDSSPSDTSQSAGNEGVGNGDDAPPPGHDDNQNDGSGASPGNPGNSGNGQGNDPHPDEECVEDLVVEYAGGGFDTVYSTVSYVLPEHVEALTLIGDGPINGTGNGLDNVLVGNGAANTLAGEAGNDQLDGGDGNDTYVYSAGDGLDLITDSAGVDTIELDGFNQNRVVLRSVERDGVTFVEVRFTDNRGREIAGQGIDIQCVDGECPVEWLSFGNGQPASMQNLLDGSNGKSDETDLARESMPAASVLATPQLLDPWTVASAVLDFHLDGQGGVDSAEMDGAGLYAPLEAPADSGHSGRGLLHTRPGGLRSFEGLEDSSLRRSWLH
ncbi:MAG: hypothetical protein AB1651_04335 [Pseudomonadota bacterium]|jgi:Ca2+-binding RTX toxin-like protein